MRIGVNVPNELMKRVKKISPAVNVSQVCREALEERVRVGERAISQVEVDVVDKQVVRLAEALGNSLIEPDWETYALEDAREWVKKVTPEIWDRCIYQYDHLVRSGRRAEQMVDIWSQQCGTRGYRKRMYDNNDWFDEQCEIDDTGEAILNAHKKSLEEYASTWLSYVLEVRRKLEKHWKDEHERVRAGREEYLLSLSHGELPPQLVNAD